MAIIHTTLIGDGTEGNAYRVDLPTYELLEVDYAGKEAIVAVPDEDVPAGLAPVDFAPAWSKRKGLKVLRLKAGDQQGWNERIRGRYKERFSNWDSGPVVKPER